MRHLRCFFSVLFLFFLAIIGCNKPMSTQSSDPSPAAMTAIDTPAAATPIAVKVTLPPTPPPTPVPTPVPTPTPTPVPTPTPTPTKIHCGYQHERTGRQLEHCNPG